MATIAPRRNDTTPRLGFLGRVRHTLHITSSSSSSNTGSSKDDQEDKATQGRTPPKISKETEARLDKENAPQQSEQSKREAEKSEMLILGPNGSISNTRMQRRRSLWKKTPALSTTSSLSSLPPALSLSFDDDNNRHTEERTAVSEKDKAPHASVDSSFSRKGAFSLRRKSTAPKSINDGAKPSPAAEVALAAWSLSASPEAQIKYHRNARLKVLQMAILAQMCSQQIKMRGLATIGIFRPFRAAESVEQQERLIELFLLYSEPKVYTNVFAAGGESLLFTPGGGSDLMRGTMGRSDVEAELRRKLSYANIYDVIALLKWGLRRLRIKAEDFGCTEPYAWYDAFVEKEKAAGYPKVAYSALLLPSLPSAIQELLDTMLDLMSTVSSHNIANAMPAARICRSLGFWLVGRIESDRPAQDLQGVLKAWEKSSLMMEHLLMAYVRDQSTRNHLMPSRLMEIVADYPCLDEGQWLPRLQPPFGFHSAQALLVDVKSTGITISPKRPRGPSETLQAALKAQGSDLEASEEVDDWSAVLGMACIPEGGNDDNGAETEPPKETGLADDLDARKESLLFSPEDARVLRVIAAELDRKKAKVEERKEGDGNGIVPTSPPQSTAMSKSMSLPTYSTTTTPLFSRETAGRLANSRPPPGQLATLVEDSPVKRSRSPIDWDTFSSGGFQAEDGKEEGATLDSMLSELYQPASSHPSAETSMDDQQRSKGMRRRASLGTVRRQKKLYESQAGSRSSSQLDESLQMADNTSQQQAKLKQTPTHSLEKVTSMTIDRSFADFWQDQLLDDCVSARLPHLLVAQLSAPTAARLLGSWVGHQHSSKMMNEPIMLLITETCIPTRPHVPHSVSHSAMSSGGGGRGLGSILRRNNFSVSSGLDDDGDNRSERRSLIAPSIRSTFTTGMEKTKLSLRRMSTLLSTGTTSASRQAEREKIDLEIAELQQAVQSKKRNQPPSSSSPREGEQPERKKALQGSAKLEDLPAEDRDETTYNLAAGVANKAQSNSRRSSGVSGTSLYQSADDKSNLGNL